MDTTKLVIFLIFVCVLIVVRVLAPFWIGRAARKRGKVYGGWVVTGLLIGPLLVGICYFCTAHRSPILAGLKNLLFYFIAPNNRHFRYLSRLAPLQRPAASHAFRSTAENRSIA